MGIGLFKVTKLFNTTKDYQLESNQPMFLKKLIVLNERRSRLTTYTKDVDVLLLLRSYVRIHWKPESPMLDIYVFACNRVRCISQWIFSGYNTRFWFIGPVASRVTRTLLIHHIMGYTVNTGILTSVPEQYTDWVGDNRGRWNNNVHLQLYIQGWECISPWNFLNNLRIF